MKIDNEYVQPVSEIRKVEGKVCEYEDDSETEDQEIKELE
jgi:hypothetical protein